MTARSWQHRLESKWAYRIDICGYAFNREHTAQRIERSYKVFLAKAKEDEANRRLEEANRKPAADERIRQLEEQNTILLECLLEMSEIVYA